MFVNRVETALGIKLRITDGYRSIEEQNALYAKGRSHRTAAVGMMVVTIRDTRKIVTKARGGRSYHNFGLAFDVTEVLENGQYNYETNWSAISKIGKSLGLEWGGDWKKFKDQPHFQMTFGRSLNWLNANYQHEGN